MVLGWIMPALASLSTAKATGWSPADNIDAAASTSGTRHATQIAMLRALQTLHASCNHGHFCARGRYSSATVRGTNRDTIDRGDGTVTVVERGTIASTKGTRKTITFHAGQSYLATAIAARPTRP